MQNKLYTIQFSHHPMTNSQSVPEQWLWNPGTHEFCKFCKTPEKDQTPRRKKRKKEKKKKKKNWTPG